MQRPNKQSRHIPNKRCQGDVPSGDLSGMPALAAPRYATQPRKPWLAPTDSGRTSSAPHSPIIICRKWCGEMSAEREATGCGPVLAHRGAEASKLRAREHHIAGLRNKPQKNAQQLAK